MRSEYGDISQRTAAYAAVQMLSHAEPIIVLGKFGQNKPIPRNKADNVKFRRPVPFAVSTTPLTEGVTPTSHRISYEDVPATLQQYGDVAELTDKVQDLSEDPVLMNMTELTGEQAAETIEMVTWGVLKAGTAVQYANGASRAAVNTTISINMIRGITRFLRAQRGKMVTQMLAASPNYATTPVEGGYIAFAHTDCEADIRDLPGFKTVAEYGSRKTLCPEECGTVENVRFILSPLLEPFLGAGSATLNGMKAVDGVNVDVYPVVVIAKEAFGVCPLKGSEAIKPIVLNPGTPSKSDPLGQVGFVGWKTWFTAVRLNEAWMARGEIAVTDLSEPTI